MSEGKLIIWGRHGDSIHVGEYAAMTEIADEHEVYGMVLSCTSWHEARDLIGIEKLNHHFSAVFDGRWEDWCVDNDQPAVERPRDWLPDDLIADEMDIFLGGGRPDDPDRLGLPEEFFECGTGGGDMLIGDWWVWLEGDLPQLLELANRLGYRFEERSDVIGRCVN